MPSVISTHLENPKSKPDLTTEDADLFRAAVEDVKPLPNMGRVITRPRPNPKTTRRPALQENIPPDLLSDHISLDTNDEEGTFVRAGVAAHTLRRLRRNHWPVEDELDLHGMTRDIARTRLVQFLNHCQQRNRICVRIIHGRGLGSSAQGPVLKQLARNWLMQRPDVLAFVPARPQDGGAGALIVLLKRGAGSQR